MAMGPLSTEQAEEDQPERTLDIECLFRELDANKDGRLDRRELEACSADPRRHQFSQALPTSICLASTLQFC